ncbi:hypothetical protein BZA70DRAFT_65924 [Myxozyma melibiosi]|uniref:Uncharacterized protein n=1 Tax=Myxozyma melibiosi TaxID=54550 RepID=A0ABR1F0W7_9ASCO
MKRQVADLSGCVSSSLASTREHALRRTGTRITEGQGKRGSWKRTGKMNEETINGGALSEVVRLEEERIYDEYRGAMARAFEEQRQMFEEFNEFSDVSRMSRRTTMRKRTERARKRTREKRLGLICGRNRRFRRGPVQASRWTICVAERGEMRVIVRLEDANERTTMQNQETGGVGQGQGGRDRALPTRGGEVRGSGAGGGEYSGRRRECAEVNKGRKPYKKAEISEAE